MRARAILSIRLLALLFLAFAFWQGLVNLIETWRDFDPSYLGYFLENLLLRPVLAALVGALLWLFSRPLGKWLGGDLPDTP